MTVRQIEPIDRAELRATIQKWVDAHTDVDDTDGVGLLEDVLWEINAQPTLTPQNEWISVEDRLPEGHMQVLMWSAKWGIAEAGSYYNSRFRVYNELGDGYVADRITHWIPLPGPPDGRQPEGEADA